MFKQGSAVGIDSICYVQYVTFEMPIDPRFPFHNYSGNLLHSVHSILSSARLLRSIPIT
jgi:hypothetical protein